MAIPNVSFTSPCADWGLSGGSGSSNTLFSPADDQTRASGQVTVVGPAEPNSSEAFPAEQSYPKLAYLQAHRPNFIKTTSFTV